MEKPEKCCPSYLNDLRCKNTITDDRKWCGICFLRFARKQNKCKKLEEKYYPENSEVPNNLSLSELQTINHKLKQIIKLRKYIHERGFSPDTRDATHNIRIEIIKKYKKLIKYELIKQYNSIILENIRHNQIDESDESDETTETTKTDESIKLNQSIKSPENIVKLDVSISKNDERAMDVGLLLNYIYTKYHQIITNFQQNAIKSLANLGKNFLAAYGLQFLAMTVFCKGDKSIRTNIRMSDGRIMHKLKMEKVKHIFFDRNTTYFDGPVYGIEDDRKFGAVITPDNPRTITTFEIDMYLQLYRQIPSIPLPDIIKSVNFAPTEEDLSYLERYYKYTPEIALNRKKCKIELIKTKSRPDYNYDLRSCLRVVNIEPVDKLICYIKKTDSPEKYGIIYGTRCNDTIKITEQSEIDVTNYPSIGTIIPLITLNESALDGFDPMDTTNPEELKAIYIYTLENQGNFLFRFD